MSSVTSHEQSSNYASSYRKISKLGEGSFGEVFKVLEVSTGCVFVSKEVQLDHLDEQTVLQLFTEVKVLEALHHPYVISIKESYRTESNKLVMILEHASGGDLKDLIRSRKGEMYEEKQLGKWMLQLSLAVKFAHDNKVLHRDIKSSNVFIAGNGDLKLGDFGMARGLQSKDEEAFGFAGTPLYIAPEIFSRRPYSFKADVWSLGIIFYELACLALPFNEYNLPSLIIKIVKEEIPQLPERYSMPLRELLTWIFAKEPERRPCIDDILASRFMKKALEENQEELVVYRRMGIAQTLKISTNQLRVDFKSLKMYRHSQCQEQIGLKLGQSRLAETSSRDKSDSQ